MKLSTILIICVMAAILASVSQGANYGGGDRTAATSPQVRALMAYGDGLNRIYHLGAYSRKAAPTYNAQRRALMIRSEALNKKYHLGAFGPR